MKQYRFDKTSAAFAQSAERQFAELNKALKTLSDSMAGLQRGIKAPAIKGGSRYTKTVRTASPLAIGSGAFSLSSAQTTSLLMQSFGAAQRIL